MAIDRSWTPPDTYLWWNSREYVALAWLVSRHPESEVFRAQLSGLCRHMEYHPDFYLRALTPCRLHRTFLEAAPTVARMVSPALHERCEEFGRLMSVVRVDLSREDGGATPVHEHPLFRTQTFAFLREHPYPERLR